MRSRRKELEGSICEFESQQRLLCKLTLKLKIFHTHFVLRWERSLWRNMEINMQILEYGNPESEKIILIHGFESPYQIWDEYVEKYKEKYCVIVPILPGHNVNEREDFHINKAISYHYS